MMRGNNREKIFRDEEDKTKIIDTLRETKKEEEYYLYAYCVMDNHIHLIIKENKDSIARTVKRIAASFSIYYNRKNKRIGHVFQERFKSEEIEDEKYLLSAIRYVHTNPQKADIGTIEGYKWSSYRDYMGKGGRITDTDQILSMFSSSIEKARAELARFNHEYSEETFLDIAEGKEIDQTNVEEYINKYLTEKGLEIGELRGPAGKGELEELIKLLLEKSTFSRRGIASILGLNREVVRKASMSRDLSR